MMPLDVRRELLLALRDQAHKQSDTAEVLHLDLAEIASRVGADAAIVRAELKDLLLEGLAEPFAETFTDRAEDGHCRITGEGMSELRRLR